MNISHDRTDFGAQIQLLGSGGLYFCRKVFTRLKNLMLNIRKIFILEVLLSSWFRVPQSLRSKKMHLF
jgi:hypothetical protein